MLPAGLCFTDVTFLMSPLSFDTGWTDNTVDEKVTSATNLVNFGPTNPEILWLVCMGGF